MKASWLIGPAVGFLLAACSSVHIQTGPPTDEESSSRSETTAKQFKTDWYTRLERADAYGKLGLVNDLINQTCVQYIKFGRQVADSWRQANKDQGRPVPASQIQGMVDRSVSTDQPMLQAQTDVIEYGVDQTIASGTFQPDDIDDLNGYRDFFNEVYNGVFLPNGTVEDYVDHLDDLDTRRASLYDQFLQESRRY